MKSIIVVILVSVFTRFGISQQSGWFWQSPNYCADVLGDLKIVSPTTGYVVGSAGIFMKSTDAGLTWSNPLCDSSYRGLSCQRLFGQYYINPNTGWTVGTYSNSITQWVLKTTNAGSFWVKQAAFQNSTGPGSVFFINELTGWSVGGITMLKTTNSGQTWDAGSYVFSGSVTSIHFSDASTGCAAGATNFYKTTDGGSSWQTAYSFYNGQINSFCFINSMTGFAAGNSFSPLQGKIFKTTNGGINWVLKASLGVPLLTAISFASANVGIGVGGNFGNNLYICKSTDAGETWNDVAFIVPYPNILTSVGFFNQSTGIAVGYDGRICRTTNAGDNWTSMNEPAFRANVNNIFFTDPQNGWLACENGTVMKTTNGGAGFTPITLGYNDNILMTSFVNSQTGYVVGSSHISTTTNAGSSWNTINFPVQFTSFSMIDQNTAYATLYNQAQYPAARLIRTSNFNASWDTIPLPISGNFKMVKFINQNTGWIVGYPYNHIICKTTDGANTWQQQLIVSSSNQLSCISAVDDQNCWISGDYGTMYRTTNGGTNWTNIPIGYTDSWYTPYVKFFNPNTGIAFTNFPVARIIRTTNGGSTWDRQVDCGVNGLNTMFFVNSMTGWAGARNVLLKTTDGGELLSLKNISSLVPKDFSLLQNYPNPFNPTTKIKFDIPVVGNARDRSLQLKIYDILGREVATLVNEPLQPGTYSVDWNGSNFASGIYFYSLTSEDFSQTRKMVLIK